MIGRYPMRALRVCVCVCMCFKWGVGVCGDVISDSVACLLHMCVFVSVCLFHSIRKRDTAISLVRDHVVDLCCCSAAAAASVALRYLCRA